jgi:hypothetical protein
VDLHVGRALRTRLLDVRARDVVSALLDLGGNGQERLQFWWDRRRLIVALYGIDEVVSPSGGGRRCRWLSRQKSQSFLEETNVAIVSVHRWSNCLAAKQDISQFRSGFAVSGR